MMFIIWLYNCINVFIVYLGLLCSVYHTIPFHSILGRRSLDLPRTTPRPIRMAQCTRCAGMGRKHPLIPVSVYPGVGGALLLLPLFCWQCVGVVCAREKEGRVKGLCLLFYELGLYVGFL